MVCVQVSWTATHRMFFVLRTILCKLLKLSGVEIPREFMNYINSQSGTSHHATGRLTDHILSTLMFRYLWSLPVSTLFYEHDWLIG